MNPLIYHTKATSLLRGVIMSEAKLLLIMLAICCGSMGRFIAAIVILMALFKIVV